MKKESKDARRVLRKIVRFNDPLVTSTNGVTSSSSEFNNQIDFDNKSQINVQNADATDREISADTHRKLRPSRALFRHESIHLIKPQKQELLQKTFPKQLKELIDKTKNKSSKKDCDSGNSASVSEETAAINKEEVKNPVKTVKSTSNVEQQTELLDTEEDLVFCKVLYCPYHCDLRFLKNIDSSTMDANLNNNGLNYAQSNANNNGRINPQMYDAANPPNVAFVNAQGYMNHNPNLMHQGYLGLNYYRNVLLNTHYPQPNSQMHQQYVQSMPNLNYLAPGQVVYPRFQQVTNVVPSTMVYHRVQPIPTMANNSSNSHQNNYSAPSPPSMQIRSEGSQPESVANQRLNPGVNVPPVGNYSMPPPGMANPIPVQVGASQYQYPGAAAPILYPTMVPLAVPQSAYLGPTIVTHQLVNTPQSTASNLNAPRTLAPEVAHMNNNLRNVAVPVAVPIPNINPPSTLPPRVSMPTSATEYNMRSHLRNPRNMNTQAALSRASGSSALPVSVNSNTRSFNGGQPVSNRNSNRTRASVPFSVPQILSSSRPMTYTGQLNANVNSQTASSTRVPITENVRSSAASSTGQVNTRNNVGNVEENSANVNSNLSEATASETVNAIPRSRSQHFSTPVAEPRLISVNNNPRCSLSSQLPRRFPRLIYTSSIQEPGSIYSILTEPPVPVSGPRAPTSNTNTRDRTEPPSFRPFSNSHSRQSRQVSSQQEEEFTSNLNSHSTPLPNSARSLRFSYSETIPTQTPPTNRENGPRRNSRILSTSINNSSMSNSSNSQMPTVNIEINNIVINSTSSDTSSDTTSETSSSVMCIDENESLNNTVMDESTFQVLNNFFDNINSIELSQIERIIRENDSPRPSNSENTNNGNNSNQDRNPVTENIVRTNIDINRETGEVVQNIPEDNDNGNTSRQTIDSQREESDRANVNYVHKKLQKVVKKLQSSERDTSDQNDTQHFTDSRQQSTSTSTNNHDENARQVLNSEIADSSRSNAVSKCRAEHNPNENNNRQFRPAERNDLLAISKNRKKRLEHIRKNSNCITWDSIQQRLRNNTIASRLQNWRSSVDETANVPNSKLQKIQNGNNSTQNNLSETDASSDPTLQTSQNILNNNPNGSNSTENNVSETADSSSTNPDPRFQRLNNISDNQNGSNSTQNISETENSSNTNHDPRIQRLDNILNQQNGSNSTQNVSETENSSNTNRDPGFQRLLDIMLDNSTQNNASKTKDSSRTNSDTGSQRLDILDNQNGNNSTQNISETADSSSTSRDPIFQKLDNIFNNQNGNNSTQNNVSETNDSSLTNSDTRSQKLDILDNQNRSNSTQNNVLETRDSSLTNRDPRLQRFNNISDNQNGSNSTQNNVLETNSSSRINRDPRLQRFNNILNNNRNGSSSRLNTVLETVNSSYANRDWSLQRLNKNLNNNRNECNSTQNNVSETENSSRTTNRDSRVQTLQITFKNNQNESNSVHSSVSETETPSRTNRDSEFQKLDNLNNNQNGSNSRLNSVSEMVNSSRSNRDPRLQKLGSSNNNQNGSNSRLNSVSETLDLSRSNRDPRFQKLDNLDKNQNRNNSRWNNVSETVDSSRSNRDPRLQKLANLSNNQNGNNSRWNSVSETVDLSRLNRDPRFQKLANLGNNQNGFNSVSCSFQRLHNNLNENNSRQNRLLNGENSFASRFARLQNISTIEDTVRTLENIRDNLNKTMNSKKDMRTNDNNQSLLRSQNNPEKPEENRNNSNETIASGNQRSVRVNNSEQSTTNNENSDDSDVEIIEQNKGQNRTINYVSTLTTSLQIYDSNYISKYLTDYGIIKIKQPETQTTFDNLGKENIKMNTKTSETNSQSKMEIKHNLYKRSLPQMVTGPSYKQRIIKLTKPTKKKILFSSSKISTSSPKLKTSDVSSVPRISGTSSSSLKLSGVSSKLPTSSTSSGRQNSLNIFPTQSIPSTPLSSEPEIPFISDNFSVTSSSFLPSSIVQSTSVIDESEISVVTTTSSSEPRSTIISSNSLTTSAASSDFLITSTALSDSPITSAVSSDFLTTTTSLSDYLITSTASSDFSTISADSFDFSTISTASSDFPTISANSSDFSTISTASSNFSTTSTSLSDYLTISTASSDFPTTSTASSNYPTTSAASSDFLTTSTTSSDFLTTTAALSDFLITSTASSDFPITSAASSDFPTISAASSDFLTSVVTLSDDSPMPSTSTGSSNITNKQLINSVHQIFNNNSNIIEQGNFCYSNILNLASSIITNNECNSTENDNFNVQNFSRSDLTIDLNEITVPLRYIRSDEDYELTLQLLLNGERSKPIYVFYKFVSDLRKMHNYPIFTLLTFIYLLKKGLLQKYRLLFIYCTKNGTII